MNKQVQEQNKRLQLFIVLIGTVLMIGKFAAYFITHSNAILTDALESIVNVVAGTISLYGLVLTAQPKDANHPYGHGKVEFIAASIEGGLIAGAGLMIIVKSLYNLIVPTPVTHLIIGLYITAGAGLINLLLGLIAQRRGKTIGSLPLQASGKHLMSDAWSTAGLIIGLLLIYYTGWWWLDSIVALLFGGIILYTGYTIIRPSLAGIMDEADYSILENVAQILEQHRKPAWIDVHNLRVIKYGSTLHIDCHVTLPWYYTVQQSHDEIEAIDQLINQQVTATVEFFIHVDPCLPDSCPLCSKEDCPERHAPFEKAIPWTLTNVMKNKKHRL